MHSFGICFWEGYTVLLKAKLNTSQSNNEGNKSKLHFQTKKKKKEKYVKILVLRLLVRCTYSIKFDTF